jgi:hypothetical protein
MGIISLSAPCVHVEGWVKDGVLVDTGEARISKTTWQGLFWSYKGGTVAHTTLFLQLNLFHLFFLVLVLCVGRREPEKSWISRQPEGWP